MGKIIKLSGVVLTELLIIAGCLRIGYQLNNVAEEKEYLTINKIAVVNLDDGVEVDSSQKYYGTEFISELDDNFEITGLEQARRGLENDLYAAYIILPATFSKNIESINSEPIKSNITYKINPNLAYEIREEVITDIWGFNNNLSTNIEYVYVDAILRGVHTVQDEADQLLANDLKDLQAVLQFTETDLVVDPEYPDEKYVEKDIENLDLSDTYASMQTVFSDLSAEYQSSQTSAQQDYDKLIEEMPSVSTKMGELNTEIGDVANIDEGEAFDIENDEKIDNYINGYNEDLTEWKVNYDNQALYNFDTYMDKCQEHTNQQLEKLKTSHKDYLKGYYESAYEECTVIVNNEMNDENIEAFNNYAKSLEIYNEVQTIIFKFKDEIVRLNEQIVMLNSKIDELNGTIADMAKAIDDLGGEFKGSGQSIQGKVTGDEFLNQTYENELINALKKDVSRIKKEGQAERNKVLKSTITNWLKEDLVYYGASGEEIGELDSAEMNGQEATELIDDWYETTVNLSIEPVEEQESPEENETTEDDTSEGMENVPDEDGDDSENDESQETEENEKTEQDIKLEKRASILFANTYAPALVDIETLNGLISNAVISPISGLIMQQYSELTTSYTSLNTVWSNWSTKLDGFTINSYGNDEKRNLIEKTFNENMKNIQTAVNNKSTEYETYVTQANKANEDNLTAWETSIQNANKETHTNIDNSIKNIKSTREQMNIHNSELMANVSNVLPYTRIGELENRNVYSYIASPVSQEDLSENKIVDNVESKNNESEDIVGDNRREAIMLSVGVLLCMMGAGVLVTRIRRNKYL